MKTPVKVMMLGGALLIAVMLTVAAQLDKEPAVLTNSGKWVDCPGMPPGCQMLKLYGDSAGTGEFAVRFKYQAKYRIGPHTHEGDEHATVISGGPFHVAVGDAFDDKASSTKTLHTSDLLIVPAGVHHYAWTDSETILQVNGIAPFKRNFINPADSGSGLPK